MLLANQLVLRHGAGRGHAKRHRQLRPRRLEDVQTRGPGSVNEKARRVAAELDDGELVVDDHGMTAEVRQQESIDLRPEIDAAVAGLGRGDRLERHARCVRFEPGGRVLREVELGQRGRHALTAPINLVPLVERFEQLGCHPGRFRRAEQQHAVRLERVMKDRKYSLLQRRLEINEDVPTADQVEMRKGRIADDVLPREDADIADEFGDAVAASLGYEEAPQALGRYLLGNALRIEAGPGSRDGRLAQIGAEHLNGDVEPRPLDKLYRGDGERIRLLTAGAAGDPDAERRVGPA